MNPSISHAPTLLDHAPDAIGELRAYLAGLTVEQADSCWVASLLLSLEPHVPAGDFSTLALLLTEIREMYRHGDTPKLRVPWKTRLNAKPRGPDPRLARRTNGHANGQHP